jgi:hypothetical protein
VVSKHLKDPDSMLESQKMIVVYLPLILLALSFFVILTLSLGLSDVYLPLILLALSFFVILTLSLGLSDVYLPLISGK